MSTEQYIEEFFMELRNELFISESFNEIEEGEIINNNSNKKRKMNDTQQIVINNQFEINKRTILSREYEKIIYISNLNEFINNIKYNKKICDYGMSCNYNQCNRLHILPKSICNKSKDGKKCYNNKCNKIHLHKCKYNINCNYSNCNYLHIKDFKDDKYYSKL
jgi:hypothetical protein